MEREMITLMLNGLDEKYISEAESFCPDAVQESPERIVHMKKKRIITFALAAALVLGLGVTAYAAGWLAPIFHSIRYFIPEVKDQRPELESYYAELEDKNSVLEAAEQYMNEQKPAAETVLLPDFDNSRITLNERYYNGETLLLGVNLDAVVPPMTVGFEPDEELRGKITAIAFFHNVYGDDNLDTLLAEGMQRDIYDNYLEHRTDYAKEYDLRNQSAITLDWMMINELTPEEYEAAWQLLRETGHLCVVANTVYVSDGITMDDGTDLGPTGQEYMDSSATEAHSGNIFIDVSNLPREARYLEELNILLRIKNVRIYYYMELGGPARYYTELVREATVPFTIKNAEAKD